MLSLYDIKQILNPDKEAMPGDDFRILKSWAEYDEDESKAPDKRKLNYLCYQLEAMNPETGKVTRYYKAIKFARVIRLPANAKQSTVFMDMQEQVLSGVYEGGYNFVTIIANVIKPVALGLLYLYGVQGVSKSLKAAKEMADYDFKGFIGMMQGTFRVLEMRVCNAEESEWLREKMYGMDYLTVIRGIPKANKAGEDVGNKGMGGSNVNPDSQGTLEELITGLADYEYIMEVLSTPVDMETLTAWHRESYKEMTLWNSQLQGQKSLSMNLSIPMMYMANASQSQGWSKAYTDANTVSYARGESFTSSQGQSVGESLSQSFGRSFGQNVSQSLSHSLSTGVSHSRGISMGESFGENRGWSQTNTTGISHGVSSSHSVGSSFGQNAGISQGNSQGVNMGSSQNYGASHSTNQGISENMSQGVSESQNASYSQGQTLGSSYGQSVGHSSSLSHTVGANSSVSASQNQNVSVGRSASLGQSRSQSLSQGLNENFGTNSSLGWNSSNSISRSYSNGASGSYGKNWGSNFSSGGGYSEGSSGGFNLSAGAFGVNLSGNRGRNSSVSHNFNSGSSVGENMSSGWNSGISSGASGSYGNSGSTGSSHSMGSSVTSGVSAGTSASVGASMNRSTGYGFSQSQGASESYGTSTGNSIGQNWGASMSNSQSVSMGNSAGRSSSISAGSSAGVSDGVSAGYGSSMGLNYGANMGTNQGVNSGVNESFGTGENWGISQSVSNGQTYGLSHSVNVGQNESVSNSQTLGQSYGQSYGESVTDSASTGYGQNIGRTESVSNGNSYTTSNGSSRGTSAGTTGTSTLGTSSSMGLGPSIGYSKSYQWLDQGVKDLLELLEYQNERIKKALRGQGAFHTYMYIACPSLDALATAQAVAKATWQNEFAMTQPLQVLDLTETEQKHLLYHFEAFSADVTKENVFGARQYKYCTVLLPEEFVAYTHLPRISEGGVFSIVQDIPKFSVPSMMKGEIYMGTILNPERFTFNNGYRTQFDYRIDEENLMHGFFTGASRSGKTVAAMRFVAELSKVRRKKTGKRLRIVCLDPKQDWRTLARFVEPERFRFWSLGNVNFRPIKINPWKVPKGVWPQVWIDGIVDIYCRAYGLLERGKQMLDTVIYALYQEAGVFDACDSDDWKEKVPELSSKVSFEKIYRRMYEEKAHLEDPNNKSGKAGNDTRDAYARLLERLSCFSRKYSIENKLYGTTEGIGIDELIGDDDVTVLESKGLENTFKNFIFGAITSGFYKFAIAHEGGYLAPDQYETVLVIEEANEILTGNDAAGTGGGGSDMHLAGQSEFEQILDQSAGYGLFIFAITQKIADMPSSIIANSGLVFAGRLKRTDDINVVVRTVGREERIDDRDLVKWFPRSPTGWFVCQTSRTFDFKDAEPILVQIARLNVNPPSNSELDEILLKKEALKQLQSVS